MACANCSSNNGVPNGCKSNGSCGTGGCGKLSVFDWLSDIELPNGQSTYDIVEVRFKGGRKAFYRNLNNIDLQASDAVVVEASSGYDVGVISARGELARLQVNKKSPNLKPHEARPILRRANAKDLEKWKASHEREEDSKYNARKIASALGLKMKISDVEYQGDGTKATFYYTADERVDFRQLIRDLADKFRVKIEMKQIGMRQEAARLGGIGSCGRELCCSTWLTDFRSVSTASARYQQLSLNPQKLAGQCGKLKCCLNYELDTYIDALKKFPKSDTKLKTQKGEAFHIKTDVFKEEMWYIQRSDDPIPSNPIPLSPERVKEIIALNKKGQKPQDLKDFMLDVEDEKAPDYTNVVGQDSLNRFDNIFKKKKKKKKKSNNRNQGGDKGGNQQQAKNQQNKGPKNPNQKGNQKNKPQNKKNNQGGNKGKQQNKPNQKRNNNQPKAKTNQGGNQNNKKRSNKRGPNKSGGNKQKPQNDKA
ncbi:MAG: hypothetical protein MK078_11715 [Crocinitomicaceae bacterium]|nr:hypothetical protein [Crocinitomicaceae bacterium]